MSWGSERGAEVVKKWCIWSSFLIGFGMDSNASWGSEGGAEVVEKWWIWNIFLIGFRIDSNASWASEGGCGSDGKVVHLEQVSFWLC